MGKTHARCMRAVNHLSRRAGDDAWLRCPVRNSIVASGVSDELDQQSNMRRCRGLLCAH